MGRWGRIVGGCVVAGAMATGACGAATAVVRSGVIDYAEGDWSCELTMYENELIFAVEATLTADSDSSGEVDFQFVGDTWMAHEFKARWQLDGTDLEVEVESLDLLTRYAMENVSTDTQGIDIQEDAEGAERQVVDVERQGDTVVFGWEDPWTGDDTDMSCTKV